MTTKSIFTIMISDEPSPSWLSVSAVAGLQQAETHFSPNMFNVHFQA